MKAIAKITLLFALGLACKAELPPDPRATKVDWASNNLHVYQKGDEVEIVLPSGGSACVRFIHAWVSSHSDVSYVILEYQVVKTPVNSMRHMEKFNVAWHLEKIEFDELRAKKPFYILRRDDASVSVEEAKGLISISEKLSGIKR